MPNSGVRGLRPMLSSETLEGLGDLVGVKVTFRLAGDKLEKHVHDENDVHVTIVAKGRIRAGSHDWSIDVPCGKLVNFRPHEPHEIMALEDDTVVFNIVKKMRVT